MILCDLVQAMADFLQHQDVFFVKIWFVNANQPHPKPWITGQAPAKHKASKCTSKKGGDIGVDVGKIGGKAPPPPLFL